MLQLRAAGKSVVLRNDAPTPFPNGDPVDFGGELGMTQLVMFDVALPKNPDTVLALRDAKVLNWLFLPIFAEEADCLQLDEFLSGARPLRIDDTFASPENGLAEAIKVRAVQTRLI